MKATGVVRRIDELGRIVVPKEIRRSLRIREGDPIEIYANGHGEVVLRKYSVAGEVTEFANQYAETMAKELGCPVCITDRDKVIAVSGISKRQLLGRSIHCRLQSAIDDREAVFADTNNGDVISVIEGDDRFKGQIVQTIISEGDAVGAVVVLADSKKSVMGELERKTAIIAARFLGKQLEG